MHMAYEFYGIVTLNMKKQSFLGFPWDQICSLVHIFVIFRMKTIIS